MNNTTHPTWSQLTSPILRSVARQLADRGYAFEAEDLGNGHIVLVSHSGPGEVWCITGDAIACYTGDTWATGGDPVYDECVPERFLSDEEEDLGYPLAVDWLVRNVEESAMALSVSVTVDVMIPRAQLAAGWGGSFQEYAASVTATLFEVNADSGDVFQPVLKWQ